MRPWTPIISIFLIAALLISNFAVAVHAQHCSGMSNQVNESVDQPCKCKCTCADSSKNSKSSKHENHSHDSTRCTVCLAQYLIPSDDAVRLDAELFFTGVVQCSVDLYRGPLISNDTRFAHSLRGPPAYL